MVEDRFVGRQNLVPVLTGPVEMLLRPLHPGDSILFRNQRRCFTVETDGGDGEFKQTSRLIAGTLSLGSVASVTPNIPANVIMVIEFLKSELAEIDEEWCAGLDYFYDRFRNESPQKDTSPEKAEPSTPGSAPKKMGMNSFLQMQRNMMKAKMENPQKAVKNDIFEHVMSFFKRILTPWPSDWPNVIDCDFSKLDSACEVDLEQTLLADKKFSRDPTSIAWRSLLEQNKWKSVSLGDWAKAFVEDFGAGQNAHGAFFAAISHLEHMGLVKANNDKKSTSVTVLYHPSKEKMSGVDESDFEIVNGDRKSSSQSSTSDFENLVEKRRDTPSPVNERKISTSSEADPEVEQNKEKLVEKEEKEQTEKNLNEVATFPSLERDADNEEVVEEKTAEDIVEDMLNAPIRPDQEQFYTADDTRRAISNLIFYSAMMFVLPLLTMFSMYHYVFIDICHLPPSEAMLYAGLSGAAVVILIAALFVYTAYKEEKDAEKLVLSRKKAT
ncbi:unnamed protein product [Caenorhabditis auriculariae]|uniref:Uncharacterized protein n=1 Tax=Caenorhabditis auriculariae TaxID=2777116 RepID=A0A8S1GSZ8_9PELO|nr:unnamed protein product [Caenorhabditis auriculariae]